jgi:intracellular protein transport protein USO1
MVIASLRDVIRKQAEELQAVKAESAQLKKSQQQSAVDKAIDVGLQKKLDALQLEREAEVRLEPLPRAIRLWAHIFSQHAALQKEISELSSQISELQEKKKEQEKEQEDLLVFLEEMSEKRKRDKAIMRTAGLEVSEDEGGDEAE